MNMTGWTRKATDYPLNIPTNRPVRNWEDLMKSWMQEHDLLMQQSREHRRGAPTTKEFFRLISTIVIEEICRQEHVSKRKASRMLGDFLIGLDVPESVRSSLDIPSVNGSVLATADKRKVAEMKERVREAFAERLRKGL